MLWKQSMFHGGRDRRLSRICLSHESTFWSWTHHTWEVFQGSSSCRRASSCWITGVKLPPHLCGIIKEIGWSLHLSFAKEAHRFCLTLMFQGPFSISSVSSQNSCSFPWLYTPDVIQRASLTFHFLNFHLFSLGKKKKKGMPGSISSVSGMDLLLYACCVRLTWQ